MEVPHLEIHIKEDSLLEGAKAILSVFRPNWDVAATEFKIFTDGITNKLLGCFNAYLSNDVILIRIYGNKTDLLIDRKAETRNIKILHLAGLAPKLYGTFNNGLVYEYVPGEVLTTVTCRLENMLELVAKKLADMHCISADGYVKESALWKLKRKFLYLVPVKFSQEKKEKRFNELFPEKLNLEKEYSYLEQKLSSLNSPIVFCHNDLLLGNIVYNLDTNSVTFIDYEYTAYNYQAYDIANHFNEYAAIRENRLNFDSTMNVIRYKYNPLDLNDPFSTFNSGVENADYSLFPDENYQKKWLNIYLERYKTNLEGCEEVQVCEEEVNQLYSVVQKFTLASHFLWGVWCLVQAEYSSIDFDFVNYAFVRFQEYYKRKNQLSL